MLNLFVGLDIYTGLLLLLALAFVLFYEAINGFHDMANAVAAVIYTRAMQPQLAVGNDSNLLIVFYVQIMPDDFVMQLHR
ncbi:hypothetical protein MWK04_03635, partial [Escherichia coli]|nr:hypothetical protein [Escherichia coli]